jgi:hypothetical protein
MEGPTSRLDEVKRRLKGFVLIKRTNAPTAQSRKGGNIDLGTTDGSGGVVMALITPPWWLRGFARLPSHR